MERKAVKNCPIYTTLWFLLVKDTGREGEFNRVDLLDQPGPLFWAVAAVSICGYF